MSACPILPETGSNVWLLGLFAIVAIALGGTLLWRVRPGTVVVAVIVGALAVAAMGSSVTAAPDCPPAQATTVAPAIVTTTSTVGTTTSTVGATTSTVGTTTTTVETTTTLAPTTIPVTTVPAPAPRVEVTQGPFDGQSCFVTWTLINGAPDVFYGVVLDIATADGVSQFRPLLGNPDYLGGGGLLSEGELMTSGVAGVHDGQAITEPIGLTFPSVVCGP